MNAPANIPGSFTAEKKMLPESEFIAGFHAIGEARYPHQHPFHLLMHEGNLTRGQLQAWALNRYYYQSHIPLKDAAILSRSGDPAFRLAWRKRVIDHDGDGNNPGGIEKWLRLVEATGLPRQQALHGGLVGCVLWRNWNDRSESLIPCAPTDKYLGLATAVEWNDFSNRRTFSK